MPNAKLVKMKKTTLPYALLFMLFGFFNYAFSQSTAYYDISVTTIWNMNDHSSVPGNAHWSDLIGATHSTPGEFVNLGEPSSSGIINVAEFGYNVPIIQEINNAIMANSADQLLQVAFPDGPEVTTGFVGREISSSYPYVTLVSMVAPSPDWFIAANSINLRSGNPSVNNGWKDNFSMDMHAYDAGSDLGMDYGSANQMGGTGTVSMINGFPIFGNKMATITFTYITSTLSTESLDPLERVKVFPNPSMGNIQLTNIQNLQLKNVEIYSVLGKLVYQKKDVIQNSSLTLDLNQLNKGIYLLKLNTSDGLSRTQKLILK